MQAIHANIETRSGFADLERVPLSLRRDVGGEEIGFNLSRTSRRLFPGAFVSGCNGSPNSGSPNSGPSQLGTTFFVWALWPLCCSHPEGPAVSLDARFMTAAKSTVMLLLASAIGWLPAGPNLTEDVAIFCPICVVFVYEAGLKSLIAAESRMWRWAVGTFIGSIWALWAMYISNGAPVPLAIALAILAFISAYLQVRPLPRCQRDDQPCLLHLHLISSVPHVPTMTGRSRPYSHSRLWVTPGWSPPSPARL